MSRIVSFRGLLANGAQERISLQTNNGLTGYRIIKISLIGEDLTGRTQESVFKINSIIQSSVTGTVDFSDQTLLGVGYYQQNTANTYFGGTTIVFDNIKFNQDIYLTHTEGASTYPVNYYIELEQMDLNLDEATVATLKNIRNND